MALYKVLLVKNGVGIPCSGGDTTFTWPLPTDDGQPGQWITVEGQLVRCHNGLHLRTNPYDWHLCVPDIALFEAEAEYDGEITEDSSDKVCVRRARLLRRVDWAEFQIYPDGEHECSSGRAKAYGSGEGLRQCDRRGLR